MKNLIYKVIKPALLGLVLGVSLSAYAAEEEGALCAPFKDAQIDQDVLAVMLKAAEDGDLYRIKPDSSKMGFCINSPLGEVKAEFRRFNGGLALKKITSKAGQWSVLLLIAWKPALASLNAC